MPLAVESARQLESLCPDGNFAFSSGNKLSHQARATADQSLEEDKRSGGGALAKHNLDMIHPAKRPVSLAPRADFVVSIYSELVGRIDELRNKTSDRELALVARDHACPGRLAASPLIMKPIGVRKP